MREETVSPSIGVAQDSREASPGILSLLLYPPISALLFGILLFMGLSRIPIIDAKASANAEAVAEPVVPSIAALFTPEIQRWAPQIVEWSEAQQLDHNLVATVMQIESCGDPHALSHAGAMGLFQVMPYHFEAGEDPYAAQTNAQRGLGYLSQSLAAFSGDVEMAMAGFNGGINGASRPQAQWAQETRDYIYWGANIYADAIAGKVSSVVLGEWLNAGGASLCSQADQHLAALPEHQVFGAGNHHSAAAGSR
jgi:soluble lytic murein transglycosylase-like protein